MGKREGWVIRGESNRDVKTEREGEIEGENERVERKERWRAKGTERER